MNKWILLVLMIYLIISSCTNENTIVEYIEKETSWKQDSRIQYEQTILMNSHFSSGILYLLGNYNYTKISITEELPNSTFGEDVLHYPLVFDYQFDSKFPIMDNYYIAVSNEYNRLVIVPNDLPNYNKTRKIISFEEIDSSFYCFELNNYSNGECIGVTKNNFCLVPYRTHKNNLISSAPKFLLMKILTQNISNEYWMDTAFTMIIEFPKDEIDSYQIVRSLISVSDGFIFSGLDKTYKIDTTGKTSKVYDGKIMRAINKNNSLFGFTKSKYLKSTNEGLSWSEIGEIDFNFSNMNYSAIKDSLIGYYNSQIFSINLKENDVTVCELDNNGLEGKSITSITEVADSLVYITTLNGLFYQSLDDFFKTKK